MNSPQVNINVAEMSKAVKAFVRKKALHSGAFVIYEQDGKIIQEDPRTGKKTIISPSKKI
jgi:hypothetical protein